MVVVANEEGKGKERQKIKRLGSYVRAQVDVAARGRLECENGNSRGHSHPLGVVVQILRFSRPPNRGD